jgi:putative ABC transport system permease protein
MANRAAAKRRSLICSGKGAMMNNWGLWLRWSWRDLRARWLQVVAIALIIALGTGVFSGLGGQKTWRIDSMNLSYDRMRMHDVKMTLSGGGFVDDAALRAALDGIEGVAAVDTRLVVSTLVDASTDEDVILVEGRLVGMSVAEGGAPVNRVFVGDGDGRETWNPDVRSVSAAT